jgi:hypothetical protein
LRSLEPKPAHGAEICSSPGSVPCMPPLVPNCPLIFPLITTKLPSPPPTTGGRRLELGRGRDEAGGGLGVEDVGRWTPPGLPPWPAGELLGGSWRAEGRAAERIGRCGRGGAEEAGRCQEDLAAVGGRRRSQMETCSKSRPASWRGGQERVPGMEREARGGVGAQGTDAHGGGGAGRRGGGRRRWPLGRGLAAACVDMVETVGVVDWL